MSLRLTRIKSRYLKEQGYYREQQNLPQGVEIVTPGDLPGGCISLSEAEAVAQQVFLQRADEAVVGGVVDRFPDQYTFELTINWVVVDCNGEVREVNTEGGPLAPFDSTPRQEDLGEQCVSFREARSMAVREFQSAFRGGNTEAIQRVIGRDVERMQQFGISVSPADVGRVTVNCDGSVFTT